MDHEKIGSEVLDLISKIEHHNFMYYELNDPEITDYEYDMMMNRLKVLENAYPKFKYKWSPTQTIGVENNKAFKIASHSYPMISLANTYNYEEVKNFYQKSCKVLQLSQLETFCELKFDGVALSLIYIKGKLAKAITRGDGISGSVVTSNALKILSIPKKIDDKSDVLEVRGEVYIPKKRLNELNELRINNNEKLWANTRNLAAGTIKSLDSKVVEERGLVFSPYSLQYGDDTLSTQEQSILKLKALEFNVLNVYQKCHNLNEIFDYINFWETQRISLAMDTDGVVIKVNDFLSQNKLGLTSHSPKWAVAFKYKPTAQSTIIRDVCFQVGRTGVITPVAVFDPTKVDGSVIERASLHNVDFIKKLDLHYEDTIYIEKGGEVIPKVAYIDLSNRVVGSRPIEFIKNCPACDGELKKNLDEAAYYCHNVKTCLPQIKGQICHFVSKAAMDIDALGSKTIDLLYENNLITHFIDIYTLSFDQLINLDGFQDRSVKKLLKSIECSKNRPLDRLVYALGIRHVGQITARVLVNNFLSLNKIINASREELLAVNEIGIKTAESVFEYFACEANRHVIKKFQQFKFTCLETSVLVNAKLNGLVIVLSGSFSLLGTRTTLQSTFVMLGAKVSTTISKSTDYLIVGKDPGANKLNKAMTMGINVLQEIDVERVLGISFASILDCS